MVDIDKTVRRAYEVSKNVAKTVALARYQRVPIYRCPCSPKMFTLVTVERTSMWYGTSPDTGTLQPLTEKFSQRDIFGSAHPITVRLRGVMVQETHDWALAGENDLMVVTKFQIGDEPPVERLLFMEKDIEPGWHDDFFNDVIFSTRDFSGERLTLRIQVYDIDNVDQGLVQSTRRLTEQAAGLFPQLAPYAAIVDFAVEPIVSLVDNIDDHDQIVDDRVTLEVAEPGTAHKLLQPGYVVYSANSIDTDYTLENSLRINDSSGNRFEEGSYVVLELLRKEIADRQYEINQKAAKLMAELNGKGQSGQAEISFLQDTLRMYTMFQKLQRAHELQSRETLTEAEKQLLEDLKSNEELKPYLEDS